MNVERTPTVLSMDSLPTLHSGEVGILSMPVHPDPNIGSWDNWATNNTEHWTYNLYKAGQYYIQPQNGGYTSPLSSLFIPFINPSKVKTVGSIPSTNQDSPPSEEFSDELSQQPDDDNDF